MRQRVESHLVLPRRIHWRGGGEAPVAVPARDVRLEVAPPAAEPQGEVAHAKVAGGGSSDEAAAVERKTKRVSFAAAEFFAGFSEY